MRHTGVERINSDTDALKAEIDRCKRLIQDDAEGSDKSIETIRRLRRLNSQLIDLRARSRSLMTKGSGRV